MNMNRKAVEAASRRHRQGATMSPRYVTVTNDRNAILFCGRTVAEAEAFVAGMHYAASSGVILKSVESGVYSINAPEELVNPPKVQP